MQMMFELLRTVVASLFLCYASWSDYRTREVSNKVWAVLAPLGFALTFSEIYLGGFSQLRDYGLCFGLTSIFALVIFYAGGFGGADAKALMCLALILPFYPTSLLWPFSNEVSPISRVLFPLSVFNNSVLLAALMAIGMLLYNLLWRWKTGRKLFGGVYKNESDGRKVLVLITGYRVSVKKLKEKWHVYPLEDVEKSAEKEADRKLLLVPKDEGRNAVVERLENAVKNGTILDSVWATPGLPFLIFVTLGLVLALFLGDIVWICIRLLLG